MAIDPVFVSLLKEELNQKITGCRIEKIQQPAKDIILFSLRQGRENCKLVISACPGRARINITSSEYENPQEPPMFCMLLRKHLLGAVIDSVSQPAEDRVMQLKLTSADEFGRHAQYSVYAELMNRTPNFILTGEDGIIIDCLHRLDYDRDMYRRLFPGMIYRLPPDNPSFSGFAPIVKREIEFRTETGLPVPGTEDYLPYLFEKDGDPFEFSYLPVLQYGNAVQSSAMGSYSELLDAYFYRRESSEILRRKSKEIRTVVANALKRTEKKLSAQREDLLKTEKREDIRKDADLITANIYRIRKGDTVLRCEDYFEENCPNRDIRLDPLKSAQENAASLYREYRKMKSAEQYLMPMIRQNEDKLEYLKSVLDETDRAESEAEIVAIREELVSSGILRVQKKQTKQRKQKSIPLISFRLNEDFELLAGKNNIQNDELTFKTAFKSDYWFHVKNYHGSHVILRCKGLEPDKDIILKAAETAARYSEAGGTGTVAVDYTKVRNVKKIPGGLPGRVTYTDCSTVYVNSAK